MSEILDLFGDPVPENWGRRGRPQHIATLGNRNKVNMLLAFGWSNERIAKALRITPPTLRKNYFRELKFRDEQRDRLDASVALKLWEQVQQGNVGAIKEFRKLLADNDLMGAQKEFDDGPKKKPLGKKEQAAIDAESAGDESGWGDDLKVPAAGQAVQ
jgi:hypothetical protein